MAQAGHQRPARSQANLDDIFDEIEEIRKRVKRPKGFTIKSLIEEGRR
jgi:hypothetical protein